CERFVADGLARAHRSDVETVVIGASWVGLTDRDDYYRTDAQGHSVGPPLDLHKADLPWVLGRFEAAVRDLVKDGKRVVIILSSPRGDAFNPRFMVTRAGSQFRLNIRPTVPRSEVLAELGGIDARLAGIARSVGAEIVDPMDEMCHAGVCPTIDAQGNPFFMDETHLRSSMVRAHFDELDKFVYLSAPALPDSQRWPNAVTHRGFPETSSWFPEPSSVGH
ncbi:MAG TPA: SGNH hydrolase domain-containing protein, partial [Steroidobacteraceae bacterium]|nr:SGNH hydrolase domain-containing protein [Steroidobacteraceae bacterium]